MPKTDIMNLKSSEESPSPIYKPGIDKSLEKGDDPFEFLKLDKDDKKDILDKHTPTIFIRGVFDEQMAESFRMAVNTVKYERKVEGAIIDINSPGGSVNSLSEILGIMKTSQLTFITYCSGHALSCGAVLLSCGEKRYVSPHGVVMVHGISANIGYGPVEDNTVHQEFLAKMNERFLNIVAKNCKMPLATLKKKIKDSGSRNLWMFAEEALKLKIVDEIGHPIIKRDIPDYRIECIS